MNLFDGDFSVRALTWTHCWLCGIFGGLRQRTENKLRNTEESSDGIFYSREYENMQLMASVVKYF